LEEREKLHEEGRWDEDGGGGGGVWQVAHAI